MWCSTADIARISFGNPSYLRFDSRILLLNRLHRGEQQHVADGGAVGQQHDQTVHAEAQAARGGQAVLQSVDVVVVHLGLAVGLDGLALGHLTLEAAPLIDGVVEFGEGVAEFDKITIARCLILEKEKPCITVDYLTAENQYNTAVLYYKGSSFATADTIVMDSSNISYSRRTNNYTPKVQSQDIDGDGIIDVPATATLPGYENLTFPEQLNAVLWYRQNCKKIELTAYTFIDPGLNYMLVFPGRWIGMVTATINSSDNSVTFWKHEGELKENEYALLTIKTVLKNNSPSAQNATNTTDASRNGYRLFYEDSEKVVYCKSIVYEGLSLTEDEIEAALKVRPEGNGNGDAVLFTGSNR